MECKTLIVIGNGFDRSLGLKTSYPYFMEWLKGREEVKNSYLYAFLKEEHNLSTWIDIENELRIYSAKVKEHIVIPDVDNKNNSRLFIEYKQLCLLLCRYLKEQVDCNSIEYTRSIRMFGESICAIHLPIFVLNFNYTDTFHHLFPNKSALIHHIHGSLADGKDIVFGIEDDEDIYKPHSFLYKSYNPNLNVSRLGDRFDDAEHIIFFGYSLGKTDHSYFDDFFRKQSEKGCKRKRFDFYYNGPKAYDDLYWQLRILTDKRMAKFRQFNDVNFINVKVDD